MSYGWMFAVAAITGLIAKENVIATFGALAVVIASGGSDKTEAVRPDARDIVAAVLLRVAVEDLDAVKE